MAVVSFHPQRLEPRPLLAYLSDILYLQVQEEIAYDMHRAVVRLCDILIEFGDKTDERSCQSRWLLSDNTVRSRPAVEAARGLTSLFFFEAWCRSSDGVDVTLPFYCYNLMLTSGSGGNWIDGAVLDCGPFCSLVVWS